MGVNKMIETPMITNIFSHIVRMDVLIVLYVTRQANGNENPGFFFAMTGETFCLQ